MTEKTTFNKMEQWNQENEGNGVNSTDTRKETVKKPGTIHK